MSQEKLWEVIRSERPATEDAVWVQKYNEARATIGLLVEDSQLQHMRNVKTSCEVWDSLQGYHQKATLTNKVLLLKQLCRTAMKENGNMEEHITTIAEISDGAYLGTEKHQEDNKNVWIVDSGATSHTATSKKFFQEFDTRRKGQVCLAEEQKIAEVQGIASVKKLVKDGYRLTFDENDCKIMKDNKLQAIAKLSPELYQVSPIGKVYIASGSIVNGHTADCQHTWHRRFGHRDFNAIKFLGNKDLATGIKIKNCGQQMICECCVKGKMARLPFSKVSKSKTNSILDLIHTDVFGPMQTVTPSNKRKGFKHSIQQFIHLSRMALLSERIGRYLRWQDVCCSMPDVGNLHIFGCSAYIHIHKEQRKKLDDKAEKFTFVGYSDESKAFRLLDTKTNRIKISCDVVFLDLTARKTTMKMLKGKSRPVKNQLTIKMLKVKSHPVKNQLTIKNQTTDQVQTNICQVKRQTVIMRKRIAYSADGLKERIKEYHQIGFLKHYLGIEMRRNEEGFYSINQAKYIKKILHRFGLQDAKGSSVPLDHTYFKYKENGSEMPKSDRYQQLIGALLYVAVNSRPDISASVAILSQHNKHPTTNDWIETKRVARYLKQTIDYELKLGQRVKSRKLIGFADADWAQDRNDRKSNSGYLYQFAGASISWACRKQPCVSLSSTEAEYIALAEATQEAVWIQRLLEDFGKGTQDTIIYEDNQSCLKLTSNKKFNNRTKHIDTKFHNIKDIKDRGKIDYQYCPTDEMPADMLTKPLAKVKLKYMAEKCALRQQIKQF
ncbi:uncharacterized protein LOC143350676 [Colletes latitarsis]|uniref:uncharacterized protein LOC143350676 n=1 Tax=Colletes latitarsis TaxID=2605962 RepID=UPI004035A108